MNQTGRNLMKALTALVATLALGALFLSTPAQAQTDEQLTAAIQAQLNAGDTIAEAAAAVAKRYPAKASTITGLATALNKAMAADIVAAVFAALAEADYTIDPALEEAIKAAAIDKGGDASAINNIKLPSTAPPTGGDGTGGTGGTGDQDAEDEIQEDTVTSEGDKVTSPTGPGTE
jgi:hypothetical protein